MKIETVADLDKVLDDGSFAWPGGYPLYFITSDGETLSFRAVNEEYDQVKESIELDDTRSGWRVCAIDVNWEDTHMKCGHTGKTIPCAYSSDEEDEDTES